METYSDRFMVGNEAVIAKQYDQYVAGAEFVRAILGELPGEAADKIAYQNAQRMLRIN